MTKAIALVSGGLDSILAANLIKNQGIDVIGLCFSSAFFTYERAVKMCEQIDIPLKVIDFTDEHLSMVKSLKYEHGKSANFCIGCHGMMMKYSRRLMNELGADFMVTGEVISQRPMPKDVNDGRFEDYILRPLCAKNLPPTKMERDGLVDREKLLDIKEGSRRVTMELAERWGIKEYPLSDGGCKLTEPGFSARLKDLLNYNKDINPDDVEMLNYGRHFRINRDVKIISARDEREGKVITPLIKKDDYIFNTIDFKGSTVILRGNPSYDDIILAAAIAGRYSKGRDEKEVRVKYKKQQDKEYNIIEVSPARDEEITMYLL
ncbi:tRNA 4-thiouridine(8) synthase ThiI [Fonticella tunisiensis]|uniref:tRNA methyltransferase n=1 Tax=Fonticella tunisiensis TaxID=1096341 RepID=A0A4R7KT15_9CLOT|nr:tRNA 4-thiouridine(8) synthase ThiI [Fonticella tunisiensis]TDT62351.1 tRNA methyltransferase [Fonticella tunisiensis]